MKRLSDQCGICGKMPRASGNKVEKQNYKKEEAYLVSSLCSKKYHFGGGFLILGTGGLMVVGGTALTLYLLIGPDGQISFLY